MVDRVHVLIGPYSSTLTFAASTVAEKHGIPMVAAEAKWAPSVAFAVLILVLVARPQGLFGARRR